MQLISKIIHVLVLEDDVNDAELNIRELRRAGYEPHWKRVETEADYLAELDSLPDLILSDFSLPHFDGLRAAKLLRARGLDIPFILVSGTVGEEIAVKAMQHGATDYLLKDRIARLGAVVERALEDRRLRDERRQADKRLLDSEMRYRRLFEAAKDGILILDANSGAIVDVNPFLMEMLGYSHADFLGKQLWEIGFFKDIVANKDSFQKLQAEGYTRYENLPLETKGGRPIWVEFISNAYNVNGQQVIQCNIRDVSERKRAELALEQLRKRLELILNSVGDGVHGVDLTGKITFENSSSAKMLGWEIGELIGTPAHQTMHHSRYDGSEYLVEQCHIYTTMRDGIRRHVTDEVFWRKDGTCFPVDYLTSPMRNESGVIIGVVVTFRDITERKQAEQRAAWLASFPERSANPILELDLASGLINYVNPAAIREFPDVQCQGFEHPSLAGLVEVANALDERKTGVVKREIVVGAHSYLQTIHYIPETHRLRVYWSDITVSKQTEDALRKSQDQLRQSQKMDAIGQLAGGVAHDFNNQLNIIMGYAVLLAGEQTEPKLRRYADNILTATHRSADLTQKLLAFSRKGQFQSVPVSIHKILAETVEMLERSIDKRIEIEQSLKAEFDIIVGDPSQLQNAFLNLAVNARDAMPEGGKLMIETDNVVLDPGASESAGEHFPIYYVKVSLCDTGTGMTDEVKSHLFEPFFTTKPIGKGTGMGLASVFGTVKNHRGTINVYSELGHGTTFKIALPLAEQSTPAEAIVCTPPKATRKLRILLVEDEEILREMFAGMLTSGGHEIVEAENGRQAVELYSQDWSNFDLVMLDMILPEMNGPDTFRAMKKLNPAVKALLSTGFSLNKEVQAILDEGVLGFIQKPFMPNDLLNLIATIIDGAD